MDGLNRVLRLALGWLAVSLLAVTADSAAASAQTIATDQAPACPANFTGHGNSDVITCTCPLSGNAGLIWGTATYTNDSAICAAAEHAGAVSNPDMVMFASAEVKVAGTQGCNAYVGSSRNGITSNDFGAWNASFYFPDITGPGCAQTFAAPLQDCPATFTGLAADAVIDCQCPANASGAVWGTWTFTNDSTICAAARHAGAIGAQGGPVRVAGYGGCDAYPGSTANGITSNDYGPWQASFYFPAISGAGCVTPPPEPEPRYYAVHFVGLQCVRRAQPFFLETTDAVLAVAFVVEQDGTIRESHTLPGEDDYYEGLDAGDFRQTDVVVWEGLTQDIDVHALLYKYDPVLPNILGGLIRATSAVGGALVAIGTGGTGAVAGAAAALAGEAAAGEVERRMSEVATPLGHRVVPVELSRVGDPASQPLQRAGPIRYHFSTTHTERGAQYELYWEIR